MSYLLFPMLVDIKTKSVETTCSTLKGVQSQGHDTRRFRALLERGGSERDGHGGWAGQDRPPPGGSTRSRFPEEGSVPTSDSYSSKQSRACSPSGWTTGFEPATTGSTDQHSDQLSYVHRVSASICYHIIGRNASETHATCPTAPFPPGIRCSACWDEWQFHHYLLIRLSSSSL